MGSREPLPGWMTVGQYYTLGTIKAGVIAYACNGSVPGWTGRAMLGDGENRISGDSLRACQLAAEDAARALVDDMAAALGGSVTWGIPCPGCGTTEQDIVVNGETQCGQCGMIGSPIESGATDA